MSTRGNCIQESPNLGFGGKQKGEGRGTLPKDITWTPHIDTSMSPLPANPLGGFPRLVQRRWPAMAKGNARTPSKMNRLDGAPYHINSHGFETLRPFNEGFYLRLLHSCEAPRRGEAPDLPPP